MTDLVQKLVVALEGLTAMYAKTWDVVEGGLAMMSDSVEEFEKAHEAARAALSEAKAGGWLPIEQASDEDKRRCWVLVGESVHLAAYIEIGFEEKRDLDGRYIYQVDPDAYWMDIDSGDPLEPSHFQPLTQPLPNPPKDQA